MSDTYSFHTTIHRVCLFLAILTISVTAYPRQTFAADWCSDLSINVSGDFSGPYYQNHPDNQISLTISGAVADGNYTLIFKNPLSLEINHPVQAVDNKIVFSSSDPKIFEHAGPWSLYLKSGAEDWACGFSENLLDPMFDPLYTVEDGVNCRDITISQVRNQDVNGDGVDDQCYGGTNQGCLESSAPITVDVNIQNVAVPYANEPVIFRINRVGSGNPLDELMDTDANGNISRTMDLEAGSFIVKIKKDLLFIEPEICEFNIPVLSTCEGESVSCNVTPSPIVPGNPPVIPPNPGATPGGPDVFNFCSQINDPTLKQECLSCAGGEKGYEGVWTAIGCIKREPESIVRKFMIVGISTGGGVALLSFLAAGFMLSTSQGNTQQIDQAKQMLTASITGLLFIIFSVGILEYIGYTILAIPGFGG